MDASQSKDIVQIDNSNNELFAQLKDENFEEMHTLSYVPSFFTTASLPFRNVNKTVFTRKASNNISLTLTSPYNIPFGKYGRLVLTLLTTHAVLSKEKNSPVLIEYTSLAQMLKELQLPKQRGKDIKEQLDCFRNATFCFEQRTQKLIAGYLFSELYDGNYPKHDVTVDTISTGNIRFTTAVQYQNVSDSTLGNRTGNFKILLSGEFAAFCQKHAVPIDYTVYKEITSASGKDIYAWLVYRNNGLKEPTFIPREKLVEQFMPVENENDKNMIGYNYRSIINEIKEIKEKYYPELKVGLEDSTGITLYKSPTPVIENDKRYALITSDI